MFNNKKSDNVLFSGFIYKTSTKILYDIIESYDNDFDKPSLYTQIWTVCREAKFGSL